MLIKKGSKEVDSSIEALELSQRIGVTFSISEGASQSLVNPKTMVDLHMWKVTYDRKSRQYKQEYDFSHNLTYDTQKHTNMSNKGASC